MEKLSSLDNNVLILLAPRAILQPASHVPVYRQTSVLSLHHIYNFVEGLLEEV